MTVRRHGTINFQTTQLCCAGRTWRRSRSICAPDAIHAHMGPTANKNIRGGGNNWSHSEQRYFDWPRGHRLSSNPRRNLHTVYQRRQHRTRPVPTGGAGRFCQLCEAPCLSSAQGGCEPFEHPAKKLTSDRSSSPLFCGRL